MKNRVKIWTSTNLKKTAVVAAASGVVCCVAVFAYQDSTVRSFLSNAWSQSVTRDSLTTSKIPPSPNVVSAPTSVAKPVDPPSVEMPAPPTKQDLAAMLERARVRNVELESEKAQLEEDHVRAVAAIHDSYKGKSGDTQQKSTRLAQEIRKAQELQARALRERQQAKVALEAERKRLDGQVYARTRALIEEVQSVREESNKWAALAIARNSQLKAFHAAFDPKTDSHRSLRESMSKLASDNAELRVKVENLTAARDSALDEVKIELENAISERDASLDTLKVDLESTAAERDEALRQLESRDNEVRRLQSRVASLEALSDRNAEQVAALDTVESEVISLQDRLEKTQALNESLVAARNKAETELFESQQILAAVRKEVEGLRTESFGAQNTVFQLLNDQKTLEDHLAHIRPTVERARELEEKLASEREKAINAIEKGNTAKAAQLAAEEDVVRLKAQLLIADEKNLKLANNLDEVSMERDAALASIVNLKERIKVGSARINKAHDAEISAKIASIVQEKTIAEAKAIHLQSKLNSAEKEVASLKKSLLDSTRIANSRQITPANIGGDTMTSTDQKIRSASMKDRYFAESSPKGRGWYVKAASNNIAFIKNSQTGKSLRIEIGFDIPGCGTVLAIDPRDQIVKTSNCEIAG